MVEIIYTVRFTLTVDRPELRGPTYPKVAPGAKVQYTETFEKRADAKRFLDELEMGGNWECDSEYVSSAHIDARDTNGVLRRCPRWGFGVRPRPERARTPFGAIRYTAA